MRRTIAPLLIVAAVTMLALPPALAAPPDRVLPPGYVTYPDEVHGPGDLCEFGVRLALSGKEGAIVFDDSTIVISPGLHATLANLVTGQSVRVNIAGSGRVVADLAPDGSGTVTVHQWGNWLHTHGELYVASGYVVAVFTFGEGGVPVGFEEDLSRARIRDLCPELA